MKARLKLNVKPNPGLRVTCWWEHQHSFVLWTPHRDTLVRTGGSWSPVMWGLGYLSLSVPKK